ncbi:hypothetical protein OROMI_014209 [Orobanche minor]
MSSIGNQNPWPSYDNYRDCSLGVCSIYCPQFCYLIFPPPPPPADEDSDTPFSPLVVAIIGVLASAFLLVSYYTIVTRYCKRRNNSHNLETEENMDQSAPDQWQVGSNGLDESLIGKITVCRYEKGDGLIEGTECAVCLSEFQENESLRLLPKCSHAFHLPCIDTWLKSHSNCPLCRASVIVPNPPAINMNTCEFQRPDDLVLVVDHREMDICERIVVIGGNDDDDNNNNRNVEASVPSDQEEIEQFTRLGSFTMCSHQKQLMISDVLKFEEIDEYVQVEIDELSRGIGLSKGDGSGESKWSGGRGKDGRLLRSPVAMKRCVSTRRFMGKVCDYKGKNLMISN